MVPSLIDRYYICIHPDHKLQYAESRNALHNELLRIFSPQIYHRLRDIDMEPEFYAWDWFIQLFMGLFPASQSFVLIDMLLSVDCGDFILICLSVALLDELRSLLMIVCFFYMIIMQRADLKRSCRSLKR